MTTSLRWVYKASDGKHLDQYYNSASKSSQIWILTASTYQAILVLNWSVTDANKLRNFMQLVDHV